MDSGWLLGMEAQLDLMLWVLVSWPRSSGCPPKCVKHKLESVGYGEEDDREEGEVGRWGGSGKGYGENMVRRRCVNFSTT